jgi:quinol monooxygenase YgiN/quercetin dioxygenase-like cupin family protein
VSPVGRYAKATAKPGQGEALTRRLLEVAHALEASPGCQLYVVNRSPGEADIVWVTELWRSQEDLDAALQTEEARARIPAVLELIDRDSFETIDLEPIGGAGYLTESAGYAIINLEQVDDSAPAFGFGELGEARFARTALGASTIGLSLQRIRPGARQSFGHRHDADEEIYVVLEGSGRVAIDGEIHEVRKLDAIRVAPRSTRAFEAGPEGLELLATGAHRPGDGELVPGYWPGE